MFTLASSPPLTSNGSGKLVRKELKWVRSHESQVTHGQGSRREGDRSLDTEKNHVRKKCSAPQKILLQKTLVRLMFSTTASSPPLRQGLCHTLSVESLDADAINVFINGVSPSSLSLSNRYTPATQFTGAVCDSNS